jgi:hypothetical protein
MSSPEAKSAASSDERASSSFSSSDSGGAPVSRYRPNYEFLTSIRGIPCLRNALLWGMGTGMVLCLHSFIRHRLASRATNLFMVTFTVVTLGSYGICRYQFEQRQREMLLFVENQDLIAKYAQYQAKQRAAADASQTAAAATGAAESSKSASKAK